MSADEQPQNSRVADEKRAAQQQTARCQADAPIPPLGIEQDRRAQPEQEDCVEEGNGHDGPVEEDAVAHSSIVGHAINSASNGRFDS